MAEAEAEAEDAQKEVPEKPVKNGRSKWAVFGEAGIGIYGTNGYPADPPMSPGTDELCGPVCGHLWGWVFEDWSLRQSQTFFEPEGMSVKYTGKP